MKKECINLSLTRCGAIAAIGLLGVSEAQALTFLDVQDIAAPTSAVELIYAPGFNSLVLKNSASAVAVVNIGTSASKVHLANYQFTDMSLSPDGRYVFAADYGGENIGYGTPANDSWVHRLDLSNGSWGVKTAYIAGNIQATSSDTFVLKSNDQWVTFTNNSWGTEAAVTRLDSSGGYSGGYYSGVYSGDFRYDQNTGRLIHGNSGLSSQEIQAFRIVNNNFVRQESSGMYGTAQGHGGSLALATDGSAFYYGSLQVDPLDASHSLNLFPELIYAASGDIAFGNGNYYNAHTGALLGTLGFSTTTYALNPNGQDFWAYDPSANMLRHFTVAVPEPETYAMMAVGLVLLTAMARRRKRLSVG